MFDYSDKNIPIHTDKTFCLMFITAVATFTKNLRWAAHFFLNPAEKPAPKNWYGFKSNNPPPQVKELKKFEADLIKLTQGLKFRPRTNEFLKKLKDDEKKIDNEENIIVKADKTSNRYVMKKEDYVKLRDENIQTVYKKK